jgi:hypothetical protein
MTPIVYANIWLGSVSIGVMPSPAARLMTATHPPRAVKPIRNIVSKNGARRVEIAAYRPCSPMTTLYLGIFIYN